MTLSVNNPESGSASEEIEVDYDSEPIESASTPAICSTSSANCRATRR